MMKWLRMLALVVAPRAWIWAAESPLLPAPERFHLFLLVGQSNMAGRGKIEAEDTQPHPRVLTLTKDGQWVPAVEPIHFDKAAAGVGPGRSFGIALAEADPAVTIGLIPAACGGSPISTWEPGKKWAQTHSKPWDDAIRRAQLAMTVGTLKGILWHQGESDGKEALAPLYAAKLAALITRFRTTLARPEVPFVIGQLGAFDGQPWTAARQQVDAAQRAVAAELPHCAFVSAAGLTSLPDGIHFDAKSQREFGQRYAKAYQELVQARPPQ